jgi:hypothetical protein
VLRLAEDLAQGQRVSRFDVSGDDGELAAGETIGYQRLARIAAVRVRRLRIRIETVDTPLPLTVAAFE